MPRYFKLARVFFKNSLIALMENRVDFLARAFPTLFSLLIGLLSINFLYSQIDAIAGWNKNELYLMLGTYNIVWGCFFGLFIKNLSKVTQYINRGELDLFLTKPINSQFYVSTRYSIDFGESATLVFGVILVIYSLNALNISPSLLAVGLYIVFIFLAVTIAYSLWFVTVTSAFWLGRVYGLHECFISLFEINKFPTDIFSGFLKTLFIYFIPLAVMVFFPTQILLGTLSWQFIIWSFLICGLSLFLSSKFWNFAIKRYSSASS